MTPVEIIAREEGFRVKPYLCSECYPTVGYGQRIGPKGADIKLYEFSIPEPVARLWLEYEVKRVQAVMFSAGIGHDVDGDRYSVLVSMAYQLGVAGLLKFKKMLAAVDGENWNEAAIQALDSRWAKQTPERAKRHADALRTGVYKP